MRKKSGFSSKKCLALFFCFSVLVYAYMFNLSSKDTEFKEKFGIDSLDLVQNCINNSENKIVDSNFPLFFTYKNTYIYEDDLSEPINKPKPQTAQTSFEDILANRKFLANTLKIVNDENIKLEKNQLLFEGDPSSKNALDDAKYIINSEFEKFEIVNISEVTFENRPMFLLEFSGQLPTSIYEDEKILIENSEGIIFRSVVEYREYASQFGLQGRIFSIIHTLTGYKLPVSAYSALCAALMAAVALLISYFVCKKYNNLLGICFYVTFLCSPWIINFARNMYWVEFTWFLPMLVALIFSTPEKKKYLCYFLAMLTILIKSLCGYEYITTIMVGLVLFPVVEFFANPKYKFTKKQFLHVLFIGISGLLGFALALFIHASLFDNSNIFDSLNVLINNLAFNRMSGNGVSTGDIGLDAALEVNPLKVPLMYLEFHKDIIIGLNERLFIPLFFAMILIIISKIVHKEKLESFVLPIIIVSLLATNSWFLLAKAHSFVHVFLNYVLWYFGFIQILLYTIVKFIIDDLIPLIKKNFQSKHK